MVPCSFLLCRRGGLQASLDEVESMEGLLELDDTMKVMIISDENEMGQVHTATAWSQMFRRPLEYVQFSKAAFQMIFASQGIKTHPTTASVALDTNCPSLERGSLFSRHSTVLRPTGYLTRRVP